MATFGSNHQGPRSDGRHRLHAGADGRRESRAEHTDDEQRCECPGKEAVGGITEIAANSEGGFTAIRASKCEKAASVLARRTAIVFSDRLLEAALADAKLVSIAFWVVS